MQLNTVIRSSKNMAVRRSCWIALYIYIMLLKDIAKIEVEKIFKRNGQHTNIDKVKYSLRTRMVSTPYMVIPTSNISIRRAEIIMIC